MSDQSFDVRARVPAELWPSDEQLPGTTREKLIEILKEYETYMQLKRELLTVDPNPFHRRRQSSAVLTIPCPVHKPHTQALPRLTRSNYLKILYHRPRGVQRAYSAGI